jgi:hypothetical protein
MNDTPTDPALADHLTEICDMLEEIGAENIYILRNVDNVNVSLELNDLPHGLSLPNAGLVLVARFPAGDGGQPQIDLRLPNADEDLGLCPRCERALIKSNSIPLGMSFLYCPWCDWTETDDLP